jgi:hypothetical protein
MSDPNRPWGTEPQGDQPTEQFTRGGPPAAGQAWPGGPAGPGGMTGSGQPYPGWQQPPGNPAPPSGTRRRAHWALGITAAAALAAGGVIAGLTLTGQPSPTAASSPAGGSGPAAQGASQGLSGQAAMLNATLSSANSPGPLEVATSSPAAASPSGPGSAASGKAAAVCAKARQFAKEARQSGFHRLARLNHRAARRCQFARHHFARHHRLFRFFLLHGVDGQYTFHTPKGTRTQAFQRGVIQSVSAGHTLVVKDGNGEIWTWDLSTSTVVRNRDGKVAQGSLSDGTAVWVGGQVVSGAKDAALVVINPPTPHVHH